jgi:hypothetical protein
VKTDEVDSEKKTLPAINSFKWGDFYIYKRKKNGGTIALFTRLNNIPIWINKRINYLNIYLKNLNNFQLKNN